MKYQAEIQDQITEIQTSRTTLQQKKSELQARIDALGEELNSAAERVDTKKYNQLKTEQDMIRQILGNETRFGSEPYASAIDRLEKLWSESAQEYNDALEEKLIEYRKARAALCVEFRSIIDMQNDMYEVKNLVESELHDAGERVTRIDKTEFLEECAHFVRAGDLPKREQYGARAVIIADSHVGEDQMNGSDDVFNRIMMPGTLFL